MAAPSVDLTTGFACSLRSTIPHLRLMKVSLYLSGLPDTVLRSCPTHGPQELEAVSHETVRHSGTTRRRSPSSSDVLLLVSDEMCRMQASYNVRSCMSDNSEPEVWPRPMTDLTVDNVSQRPSLSLVAEAGDQGSNSHHAG